MKKLLNHIRLAARSAAEIIAKPYAVRVLWGADAFTHRAATLTEATNWAALYPATAEVWITTRTGRLVSYRPVAKVFGWNVA